MLQKLSNETLQVRKVLKGCISEREHEFLAIGNRLNDITSGSLQLASESQHLIEATSDTILASATEQLADKLQKMFELCTNTETRDIDLIHSVQRSLTSLTDLITNYSRIVKTLQMLGISTRIESARLGSDGKGFTTLADDVEKLALKIVEYSSEITGYVEQLNESTSEAELRLGSLREMQKTYETVLYVSSGKSLERLTQHSHMIQQASDSITTLMETLNSYLSDIVSAMQFHDIVRQQVEHVEENIGEVLAYCEAHNNENNDVLLFSLAEVASLQAHQLKSARTSFYSAVETLRDDLFRSAELVMQVSKMASSTQKSDTLTAGNSCIMGEVSQSVKDVSKHIESLASHGEDIGSVISRVVKTVRNMADFLDDIEEVGTEIGLIAMNASIRAAHTGEKGRALGVLAGAIQHLSQDAGEQTGAIATTLSDVAEMAKELEQQARGYFNAEKSQVMIAELSELLTQLENSSDNTNSLNTAIRDNAGNLAHMIENEVETINVHVDVCEVLEKAEQELHKVNLGARNKVADFNGLEIPLELQTLLERYTMEKERSVHQTVIQTSSDSFGEIDLFASEAELTLMESNGERYEEEFGDNIELF